MLKTSLNVVKTNWKLLTGVTTTSFFSGYIIGKKMKKRISEVEFGQFKVKFDEHSQTNVDIVMKTISTRNCENFEKYSKKNTSTVEKKGFVLNKFNVRYFMRSASLFLVSITKVDILNKKYICFNEKGFGILITEEDYNTYYQEWKKQLDALDLLMEFEKCRKHIVQIEMQSSYVSRDDLIKKKFVEKYPNLKEYIKMF